MYVDCLKPILMFLEDKGNPLMDIQEYPGSSLGAEHAHPLAQVIAAPQIPGFIDFIKHVTW